MERSDAPRDEKRIVSIQYLRAAAAFAVVLHHALDRSGIKWAVGAAGVDVFFVISGFIMIHNIMNRPATATEFLWNRASRIIPLYWAATLGITALALVVPAAMPNLQPDAARLVASLLFIPHADPRGDLFPLLVPGWTLNYEMFFYVIVACALLLPRSIQISAIFSMLLGLVAVGVVLQPVHPLAVVWTSGLLLQFLAGGVIAVAYRQGRLPSRGVGLLLLAGGVAAYALLEFQGFYSESWRFLLWGVPATAIVVGCLSAEPASESPSLKWMHHLGDASYSIYLTHTIVVAAVARLLGTGEPMLLVGATLIVATLVGMASYRLFEVPSGRWLRQFSPGRQGRRSEGTGNLPNQAQ